jgi:hypothetical protein
MDRPSHAHPSPIKDDDDKATDPDNPATPIEGKREARGSPDDSRDGHAATRDPCQS